MTCYSGVGRHLVQLDAATQPGSTEGSWVHLLPAGTFSGKDGRGPWQVADAQALILESRRWANNRPLPIDYDHAIDRAPAVGGKAPAAGWIAQLEARPDGIWGRVEWTERGAKAVAAREWRFLSPTFHFAPGGRVIRLLRAALTNNPALELTALAAEEPAMEEFLIRLRSILKLPDDADGDAIVKAIEGMMTETASAIPDPARWVPMTTFQQAVAEANRLSQGVSQQTAQAAVEREIERGHLAPYLRDWGVALCSVNKPAFDDFVAKTGPSMRRLFEVQGPVGVPPRAKGHQAELDAHVAKQLGHSVEDLQRYRSE